MAITAEVDAAPAVSTAACPRERPGAAQRVKTKAPASAAHRRLLEVTGLHIFGSRLDRLETSLNYKDLALRCQRKPLRGMGPPRGGQIRPQLVQFSCVSRVRGGDGSAPIPSIAAQSAIARPVKASPRFFSALDRSPGARRRQSHAPGGHIIGPEPRGFLPGGASCAAERGPQSRTVL